MDQTFILIGSLLGGLGVALGAFGAHALRQRLAAEGLARFETGVRYHIYHALAMVALGAAMERLPGQGLAVVAGWLLFAGVLVFSGSLYLLAFTGVRRWGAVTPFGGVAMIAGWLCLAFAALG